MVYSFPYPFLPLWVLQLWVTGIQVESIPTTGYLTLDRFILLAVAIVATFGYISKIWSERKSGIHETQSRAITAYKNVYDAQTLELTKSDALLKKTQEELDEVTEEYKTLAGIDMKLLLDFAREGFLADIERLNQEIIQMKRRDTLRHQSESGEYRRDP